VAHARCEGVPLHAACRHSICYAGPCAFAHSGGDGAAVRAARRMQRTWSLGSTASWKMHCRAASTAAAARSRRHVRTTSPTSTSLQRSAQWPALISSQTDSFPASCTGMDTPSIAASGHHIGISCHNAAYRSARSARAEANAAMPAKERRQCVAITAPGCNHKAGVMATAAQVICEGVCHSTA
jgi:hypothetical protein